MDGGTTGSGTKRRYRHHSVELRQAIMDDAASTTVKLAAAKHDVHPSLVSGWIRKANEAAGRAPSRPRRTTLAAAPADAKADAGTAAPTPAPATEQATPPSASATETPRPARAPETPVAPAAATVAAAPTVTLAPMAKIKRVVARIYSPSQRAEMLEYAAVHGEKPTIAKFGVSRYSLWEWKRKLAKAAEGKGPDPTSGPAPRDVEAVRDKEILDDWRRHPGLGPSQIKNQLARKGIRVGTSTVRRVMEDAGYRPPKVERVPHDERFEAVRPNHLWHMDFVHRYIHKASVFTLILIDDYSRFVTGFNVDDAERADLVIGTFERATQRHGRPERVMSDKGSAFWSWKGIGRFTHLLTEMGIDQVIAEAKEHNGKVEVFNANLHKELFNPIEFGTVDEMRRRLGTHLHWYNHGRTHHALGGLLVPADRFYGRAEEILARIHAGGVRDAGDGIDLGARALDLVRVTSHVDSLQVWMMGRKLFETKT